MIAMDAFVGAFTALVVFAEFAVIANRLVRYLVAFVCGMLLTVMLGWAASWIDHVAARLG